MSEANPFDGDDDAALRYAIALSLQDADQAASPKVTGDQALAEAISISSDDEDDDLDNGPRYPPITIKKKIPAVSQPMEPIQAPFGLANFDRKQMEADRLARIGKRKVSDSAEMSQNPGQKPRIETSVASPADAPIACAKGSLQFPQGAVKKTWAFGYPRSGNDIKIEEVLRKSELELAVLSSYQWDDDWLLSKIDARKTRVLLVAYAENEAQRQQIAVNAPNSNFRFCFPPMLPFGTMHSKLQLLKYAESIRIVVPSGNLVPYDWGETGVMENILFLIDLPYIKDPDLRASNVLTPFGKDLACFLTAQGLGQGMVDSLKNYDFTATTPYAFISSIGQTVDDNRWSKTGFCGLGSAVSKLSLNTTDEIEIDYAASSLGALKIDFLSALYNAAQGDDGTRSLEQRSAISAKKLTLATVRDGIKSRFRVYFPSHEAVAQSRGGTQSGGTICLQREWWNAPTFPRDMIRECKSVRSGLLMHSKVMLVRSSSSAWAYVGSANISESAWGRLTVDKKTGNRKVTCRNWECGVLVPTNRSTPAQQTRFALSAVFEGIVPVPMAESANAYGASGTMDPWFYREA